MGFPVVIVGAGIDWPAWVQAVGSVAALGALFVAQRLDHTAARNLRDDEHLERQQRLSRASITAAKFVTASIASARDAQVNTAQTGWISEVFQLNRIDLEAALNALRDTDRGSLPDEQAVVAVVNLLQAGHVADLLLQTIIANIDAERTPKPAPLDEVVTGAEGSLRKLTERWQAAGVLFE